MKLTKEAGKQLVLVRRGQRCGSVTERGQIRCRLRFRERWLRTSMLWRFTGRYLTATGRCPDRRRGNNLLAAFYIQTDAKDLNVMYTMRK